MKSRIIVSLSLILGIVLADQLIKHAIMSSMVVYERIELMSWFQLVYIENQGMAFGMSFFGTWLLALLRLAAIGGFAWYLCRCVKQMYPMGYIVCVSMIIAGAVGNIIDNVCGYGTGEFMNGVVTDMFYFPLFAWPDWVPVLGGRVFFSAVFNFADAAISCGAIALVLFYAKLIVRERQ